MSETIRIHRIKGRRTAPFVTIDKTIFNDPRLSFKAKGVLGYLLGKQDDWTAHRVDIAAHSTDGIDAIKNALEELRLCGYATCQARRGNDGRIIQWVWRFYETPALSGAVERKGDDEAGIEDVPGQLRLFEKLDPDYLANNPEVGFPHVADPHVAKPHVLSNKRIKERITNERTSAGTPRGVVADLGVRNSANPRAQPAKTLDQSMVRTARPRKQLRFGGAFPADLKPISEMLERNGYRNAQDAVMEFGADRVRIVVANFEWLRLQGKQFRNPTGWIRDQLMRGVPLIEGVKLAETRDEVKREQNERRMDRLAETDQAAFDREHEKRIKDAIDALDDETFNRLVKEIDPEIPRRVSVAYSQSRCAGECNCPQHGVSKIGGHSMTAKEARELSETGRTPVNPLVAEWLAHVEKRIKSAASRGVTEIYHPFANDEGSYQQRSAPPGKIKGAVLNVLRREGFKVSHEKGDRPFDPDVTQIRW